jgi:hypothetical protein
VDKELPARAFGQFNLPQPATTMCPTVASAANENVVNSNQATTNAIMTPRDLVPNAPGAFAVNGPNDVPGGQDDDNFTQQDDSTVDNNIHAAPANPANPVEARLVDNSDDVETLQEQLQQRDEALRQREEELAKMRKNQQNIMVGQVLDVDNNEDEDDEEKAQGIHSSNKDPSSSSNNKSMCVSSKRKVTIAVVAVLVIVAVVVGIVVAMSSKSAKTGKWTHLCDESSSSFAKRLACVSEDESKFSFGWLWQQYWCVLIMCTTLMFVCHFIFCSFLGSLLQ